MNTKDIVRRALEKYCLALEQEVDRKSQDTGLITALACGVNALSRAMDSTDFDDGYRGIGGISGPNDAGGTHVQ